MTQNYFDNDGSLPHSPTASDMSELSDISDLGVSLKGRGKQFSVESEKVLHYIQDIKKSYEILMKIAEEIQEDTDLDDYDDLCKAKAKLAQLLGSIEKLQFNQLDAVTTAHLDSGKAEAKTTRRELNASLDELQEFVRSLFKKFDAVTPPPSPPRPVLQISSSSDDLDNEEDSNDSEDGSDSDDSDASDEEIGSEDESGEEEEEVDMEEVIYASHQDAAAGQVKAQVQAMAPRAKITHPCQQQPQPQARKLKIHHKQRDQHEEQQLMMQWRHAQHLREQERQEQLRWQQEQQWREQQRRRHALQQQQQQQREQQLREQKLREQQQHYYRHRLPRRSLEDSLFGGFYF